MKKIFLFSLVFTLSSVSPSWANEPQLNRLAMGSCNKSKKPQPLWPIISSFNPDLFMFTGDVVYLDTTNFQVMKKKYVRQSNQADYVEFKEKVPIIGVWDDHDFGRNNGGKNYPEKDLSQELFLDFIGEPLDSERRKQKGIYTSYTYGAGKNSVKVILLDTRYHRETPDGKNADILGDKQWEWFENQLKSNQAQITLIVSSYSVLSKKFPLSEEWARFKTSKKRLFQLIEDYKPRGLAFLTGDRHFSGYLKETYNGAVYHEFMGSGLTHKSKLGPLKKIFTKYYGKKNVFYNINFTLFDFLWDKPNLEMTFRIIDRAGNSRVKTQFVLKDEAWVELK